MCGQMNCLNEKKFQTHNQENYSTRKYKINSNAANKVYFYTLSSHLTSLQISMSVLMPHPAYSSALNHWEI